MFHLGVAEIFGDCFELGDFAVVEVVCLVTLPANDVVVVMVVVVLADVQLEERFSSFCGNASGDAGGLEGFQVSVDRNEIVLFRTESGVSVLGAERFFTLDQGA